MPRLQPASSGPAPGTVGDAYWLAGAPVPKPYGGSWRPRPSIPGRWCLTSILPQVAHGLT